MVDTNISSGSRLLKRGFCSAEECKLSSARNWEQQKKIINFYNPFFSSVNSFLLVSIVVLIVVSCAAQENGACVHNVNILPQRTKCNFRPICSSVISCLNKTKLLWRYWHIREDYAPDLLFLRHKFSQSHSFSSFFFLFFLFHKKAAIKCKLVIWLPSNLAHIKRDIRHILGTILAKIRARSAEL